MLWLLQSSVQAFSHTLKAFKNEIIRPSDSSYLRDDRKIRNTFLFAEKAKLTFTANFDVKSDKLPTESSSEAYEFCVGKQCTNHFLSAGGKSIIQEVELDNTLKTLWGKAAEDWSGIETLPNPENGDCVVSTETSINFPSLKLLSTVYSGKKLLRDANGNPYNTFVGIADKRTPVGPAPIVWIYNKLTGGGNNETEYSPPSGRAQSNLTVDETNDEYAIRFQATIQIIVEFPYILMKLLPASKEKLEEDGSASVYKSLDKDIQRTVASVGDVFRLWKETNE